MNTTLLVNLSGNTYERIDLFEEIPITLTIQQQDLTNLTSRRVPYSRTIQVPDTSNNAILFEHYYEVNGVEFNPLNKIKCVVQYRGTDIFQGILRLNSVIQTSETRIYEIFLLGTVSDWVAYFRDLELQDLDFSDLNHEQSYSAVTKSWECENDGLTGLFGGQILYPLINYGLDYQGDPQQPTFTIDFDETRSFDQSGFPVPVSYFKPAIQVKTVLDRVFLTTPFEVRSDFFNTPYFSSIYMDTFQNGKVGIETASGVTNQNIFLAQRQQFQFNYPPFTSPGSIGPQRLTMSVNTPGGYDPLGNFNFTTNLSTFQAPYAGQYDFNVRFNLRGNLGFLAPIQGAKLALVAFYSNSPGVYNAATIAYQSPDILLSQSVAQDLPINLFFSVNMLAGRYLTIALVPQEFFIPVAIASSYTYLVKPFNQGGVVDNFVRWELYQGPVLTTEVVDMRVGMPNIGCFDFFKSMITMFNLVVQQEDDNVVRIEPYNWFYDDPERPEKDWTNILDVNSQYKIEPLTFDLSKDVVWTYKSKEFEYLPKEFFDRFDFVYGRKKFTTTNDIFVGVQTYEIPFGPCPTSGVTNAPNFIIPKFYFENNGQQLPYATEPHLFFWCGNRWAYKDIYKTDQGSWYLLSGSTPVEWKTYPCVSHLSTLESQFPDIISDLNFNSTFDFFGNTQPYIGQFTPYDLYNSFWDTYVENLYSNESRRLSGKFFLRPLDIYNLEINDKIWVKDAQYSIEKITDANLVSKTLTDVSLIKEKFPYYTIEPPAPIYAVTPNQPYPFVEPFFISGCFVSTDQDAVCNGTANIENVGSFSNTGTIENFDKVYYDSGTAWVLYPMGTYIRQLTSSTTFVVADTYGRVLEQPC
jgi:hypothetical protein